MCAAGLPVCLTRAPKPILHPPPINKSDMKPVPGINGMRRKTKKKHLRKGKTETAEGEGDGNQKEEIVYGWANLNPMRKEEKNINRLALSCQSLLDVSVSLLFRTETKLFHCHQIDMTASFYDSYVTVLFLTYICDHQRLLFKNISKSTEWVSAAVLHVCRSTEAFARIVIKRRTLFWDPVFGLMPAGLNKCCSMEAVKTADIPGEFLS